MLTKFIEATNGELNWGKFMLARFEPAEWSRKSVIDIRESSLLAGRGWSDRHLLIVDLQTGEGAIFRPGGSASYDLCEKHKIWVCPLFEPFLEWLYQQDLTSLADLPDSVNLKDAPFNMFGYRRAGRACEET